MGNKISRIIFKRRIIVNGATLMNQKLFYEAAMSQARAWLPRQKAKDFETMMVAKFNTREKSKEYVKEAASAYVTKTTKKNRLAKQQGEQSSLAKQDKDKVFSDNYSYARFTCLLKRKNTAYSQRNLYFQSGISSKGLDNYFYGEQTIF